MRCSSSPIRSLGRLPVGLGAKPTVMGGQQVCNQACRPCNDGGDGDNTIGNFLFFFCAKSPFWREIESGSHTGEGYKRRSCQE